MIFVSKPTGKSAHYSEFVIQEHELAILYTKGSYFLHNSKSEKRELF